jgi:hypothetical protein
MLLFWNKKQGANNMEDNQKKLDAAATEVKECSECKKEKPSYRFDLCLECYGELFI